VGTTVTVEFPPWRMEEQIRNEGSPLAGLTRKVKFKTIGRVAQTGK
jgi:hypothetical protein